MKKIRSIGDKIRLGHRVTYKEMVLKSVPDTDPSKAITKKLGDTFATVDLERCVDLAEKCLTAAHMKFEERTLSSRTLVQINEITGAPIVSEATISIVLAQYILNFLTTEMDNGQSLLHYLSASETELTHVGLVSKSSKLLGSSSNFKTKIMSKAGDIANMIYGPKHYMDETKEIDEIKKFVNAFVEIFGDKSIAATPIENDADMILLLLVSSIKFIKEEIMQRNLFPSPSIEYLKDTEIPRFLSGLSIDQGFNIVQNQYIDALTEQILSQEGLHFRDLVTYDSNKKWYGFSPDLGLKVLETYGYATVRAFILNAKMLKKLSRAQGDMCHYLATKFYNDIVFEKAMSAKETTLLRWYLNCDSGNITLFNNELSKLSQITKDDIEKDIKVHEKLNQTTLELMADTIDALYRDMTNDDLTSGCRPYFVLDNGVVKLARLVFVDIEKDKLFVSAMLKTSQMAGTVDIETDAAEFDVHIPNAQGLLKVANLANYKKSGTIGATDLTVLHSDQLGIDIVGISKDEIEKRAFGRTYHLEITVDESITKVYVEKHGTLGYVKPSQVNKTLGALNDFPGLLMQAKLGRAPHAALKDTIIIEIANGFNSGSMMPIVNTIEYSAASKDPGLLLLSVPYRELVGQDTATMENIFYNSIVRLNREVKLEWTKVFGPICEKHHRSSASLYRILANSGLLDAMEDTPFGLKEKDVFFLHECLRELHEGKSSELKKKYNAMLLPRYVIYDDKAEVVISTFTPSGVIPRTYMNDLMLSKTGSISYGKNRYGNTAVKLELVTEKNDKGEETYKRWHGHILVKMTCRLSVRDDLTLIGSEKIFRFRDSSTGSLKLKAAFNYNDAFIQNMLTKNYDVAYFNMSGGLPRMQLFDFASTLFKGSLSTFENPSSSSAVDTTIAAIIRGFLIAYRILDGYWEESEVAKCFKVSVIYCWLISLVRYLKACHDSSVKLSDFGEFTEATISDLNETLQAQLGEEFKVEDGKEYSIRLTLAEIKKVNEAVRSLGKDEFKNIITLLSKYSDSLVHKKPEYDDVAFIHYGLENYAADFLTEGVITVAPPKWVQSIANPVYADFFEDPEDAQAFGDKIIDYLNYGYPYKDLAMDDVYTDTEEKPDVKSPVVATPATDTFNVSSVAKTLSNAYQLKEMPKDELLKLAMMINIYRDSATYAEAVSTGVSKAVANMISGACATKGNKKDPVLMETLSSCKTSESCIAAFNTAYIYSAVDARIWGKMDTLLAKKFVGNVKDFTFSSAKEVFSEAIAEVVNEDKLAKKEEEAKTTDNSDGKIKIPEDLIVDGKIEVSKLEGIIKDDKTLSAIKKASIDGLIEVSVLESWIEYEIIKNKN